MDEKPHFFFHSFPRPRAGEDRNVLLQRGKRIFESMLRVGLALAPERIVWKQPVEGGGNREIEHLQNRICFTELREDQLAEHASRFGPFTLRFDLEALRKCGALPTIYIPQNVGTDRRLSAVGSSIVAQLSDARYTLSQLHQLHYLSNEETLLEWAKNKIQLQLAFPQIVLQH